MCNDGIGVPVAKPMLSLQPCNDLHVLLALAPTDKFKPVTDGVAMFLLDKREIGGWPFDFLIRCHVLSFCDEHG